MKLYDQNNFLHILVYVVLLRGQYQSLQMQLQVNIDKNCKKCYFLTKHYISQTLCHCPSYKHNLLDMELFPWEYPMIYTLTN